MEAPAFPPRLLLPTAVIFGGLGAADAIGVARAAMHGPLVPGDWVALAFACVFLSGCVSLLLYRRRLRRVA